MSESGNPLPDKLRHGFLASEEEEAQAESAQTAAEVRVISQSIGRATTPFHILDIPPPSAPPHPFVRFSRLAGFTILTYFKHRGDRAFLLHVARKMDIPLEHAEAVIKFMHWQQPPPPGEPGNPVPLFRRARKRVVDLLRDDETLEGEYVETAGVAGRMVKRVNWRWRGRGGEVSIPLQVFGDSRDGNDQDTW